MEFPQVDLPVDMIAWTEVTEDILNTVSYTHLDVYKRQLHHRPGGNQEDSEVIGLRQAGKLRLANIQWHKLEQGEQHGRVHHLGTGKGEAEYGLSLIHI